MIPKTSTTKEDHDDKPDDLNTSKYMATVARLNYLTSDRPDIAFTLKELAGSMGTPS